MEACVGSGKDGVAGYEACLLYTSYQPRNWMERSGNKHAMIGNAGQLSEIIDKMEMICHLYMYPTAFTIEAADYVLPTQEWLESYFTIAHANKIIIRQPVVHLYETVNEGVIWSEIAHRCACLLYTSRCV